MLAICSYQYYCIRSLLSTFYCFFIFLLTGNLAIAQESNSDGVTASDLQEKISINNRIYEGSSLWGYINGGADIYLEYGFDKVLVQDINRNEKNYKIDIYFMEDSTAAFGIFSVSQFLCKNDNSLCQWYCSTPYHIQMACGNKYISIINEKGSKESYQFSKKLADILIDKYNTGNYFLPGLFNHDELKKHQNQVKLIKGPLGLQNGFPEWSDKFENIEKKKLWIMPVKTEGGDLNLALVEFPDRQVLHRFYDHNNIRSNNSGFIHIVQNNSNQIFIWELPPGKIVYLESDLSKEETEYYVNLVERFTERDR
ncbi:MAG: hypothetical protein KAU83_00580 [Bacteroidales bacterium]|nr:hypothetical protein [Bacteroidales bacterium]